MDGFSLFTALYITLIITGIGFLLNIAYNHGKCIIKLKEKSGLPVFWVVLLIIWIATLCYCISNYINYREFRTINYILSAVFWIEVAILNIIRSLRRLEIRENGIYDSVGVFYKWTKIQNYSWILPNKIQLKVKANFIEISIKEEFKLKVDEIIQSNIHA